MPRNPALEGVRNVPAPGISYFSPYQNPKSGTAADPQSDGTRPPKLFQPWKLRGLTFQNRIGVSARSLKYFGTVVYCAPG